MLLMILGRQNHDINTYREVIRELAKLKSQDAVKRIKELYARPPGMEIRPLFKVDCLQADGTVLGILPEMGYTEQSCPFTPGDLIAIYSDGVTEAEDPGASARPVSMLTDDILTVAIFSRLSIGDLLSCEDGNYTDSVLFFEGIRGYSRVKERRDANQRAARTPFRALHSTTC